MNKIVIIGVGSVTELIKADLNSIKKLDCIKRIDDIKPLNEVITHPHKPSFFNDQKRLRNKFSRR